MCHQRRRLRPELARPQYLLPPRNSVVPNRRSLSRSLMVIHLQRHRDGKEVSSRRGARAADHNKNHLNDSSSDNSAPTRLRHRRKAPTSPWRIGPGLA